MPQAELDIRTIPANQDAERLVLGQVLLTPGKVVEVRSELAQEDFSLDSHRRVYLAMLALEAEGITVDYVTLGAQLKMRRELEAIGGISFLASLTELLPKRDDLSDYYGILREKTALRKLLALAQDMAFLAQEGRESASIASRVGDGIAEVLEGAQIAVDPLIRATIGETLATIRRDRLESKRRGVSYGLPSLDEFTGGGMRKGEVTVVGARSGVGKSSLMAQAAVANARIGIPVCLFSLEMTREQIDQRILAVVSGVPFKHIDRRLLSEADLLRLDTAGREIATWPLRIYDKSDMHIEQIVGLAKLTVQRDGTELVCVDYAQIVTAEGKDERTKVGSVSQKLTTMIKHQPASVLLLSQLRKVDREHYSKPPIVLDLLETGKLEANSHTVLLLHRGWSEEEARISDNAEVIVAKQRRGDLGTLPFRFSRRTVTFEEM